jgi:hypothetical protein
LIELIAKKGFSGVPKIAYIRGEIYSFPISLSGSSEVVKMIESKV